MNTKADTMQKKMTTLSEQSNVALADGYTENFGVESKTLVITGTHHQYLPEQIKIVNFYRFEGNTDPQDSSILYLIETHDGKKGTLVDAYGAYADARISEFIRLVEDIHKKSNDK